MRQSKWISCYPAITPSQSSEAGNLLIDNQPGTSQSHNKLTHADAITDITLFNCQATGTGTWTWTGTWDLGPGT